MIRAYGWLALAWCAASVVCAAGYALLRRRPGPRDWTADVPQDLREHIRRREELLALHCDTWHPVIPTAPAHRDRMRGTALTPPTGLPAATPDDTDPLERARLAQGAEGGDD